MIIDPHFPLLVLQNVFFLFGCFLPVFVVFFVISLLLSVAAVTVRIVLVESEIFVDCIGKHRDDDGQDQLTHVHGHFERVNDIVYKSSGVFCRDSREGSDFFERVL